MRSKARMSVERCGLIMVEWSLKWNEERNSIEQAANSH
jgi:hypothetical protein